MNNNTTQKKRLPVWIVFLITIAGISFLSMAYLIFTHEEPISSVENITDSIYEEPIDSETALPGDFKYGIITDESDPQRSKTILKVLLSRKITEAQISQLSIEIFNGNTQRDKTFILFYLPDMKPANGAWASGTFNPSLVVKVFGTTEIQDSIKNEITREFDGDILGKWRQPFDSSFDYVIYNKGNNPHILYISHDGIILDSELKITKLSTGVRYDEISNDGAGEYFIVNSAGNLDLYNEENKLFSSAYKID